MAANSMHDGAGTVDQQLAQIRVAALADPAEPLLATARMLLWNQADPGGKVPPRGKGSRIANRGRQCRGGNRSNAGDRHEPPRDGVGLGTPGNLTIQLLELLFQGVERSDQHL